MARIATLVLLLLFAFTGARSTGGFEPRGEAKAASEQEPAGAKEPEESLRSRASRALGWRQFKDAISFAAACALGFPDSSRHSPALSLFITAEPRALYALQRSYRL